MGGCCAILTLCCCALNRATRPVASAHHEGRLPVGAGPAFFVSIPRGTGGLARGLIKCGHWNLQTQPQYGAPQ